MRPPFWWSEIRARGACSESLKSVRNIEFLQAIQTAKRSELLWLLTSLQIAAFAPSRYTNETEDEHLARVRPWMEFHQWRLLAMLKVSWNKRRRITQLTNQLSKALRRRR